MNLSFHALAWPCVAQAHFVCPDVYKRQVGCIAMLVLAFLVSPFGLPALGGWLVERLHGVKYTAMDFMAS